MTTQQIKYFLTLANELHFWKTSEKVSISQSALSRQIQALEDEIGIQLFKRNKRNVKLTDAGKFLKEQWTNVMSELDQIHRQAKKIDEGKTGTISITYPGSIAFSFLPDFLEIINTKLPDLKLELTEPIDENHQKLLLNYETDISFNRDPIKNNSIHSLKLYSEPVCLVLPESKKLPHDIRELQNENFIISGLHRTTSIAALLRTIFNEYDFEPKRTIESDFGGMILNLVSKGLGISILPLSYKFANTKNVYFVPLEVETNLYVHWRKNEENKVIPKIIDFAKNLNNPNF
ncbi:DNA-binding transcriptional LysR family regulator [Wenyingzhuangia heitensis]|uniref:DNA-binding transcriptional LysR family regulator n=1 Tax=Wenyingzhuangia heitensis TaxID=1487859 RepID=A0ABX0U5P9_9FLAO|nr:LysR substrate-binding domain-containing protein [Wenyingzhuangia heitensis]NIJ43689.1 DNA-binding transcriptional LysR family regulator [Wenyingzhuangia heitensis]